MPFLVSSSLNSTFPWIVFRRWWFWLIEGCSCMKGIGWKRHDLLNSLAVSNLLYGLLISNSWCGLVISNPLNGFPISNPLGRLVISLNTFLTLSRADLVSKTLACPNQGECKADSSDWTGRATSWCLGSSQAS